MQSRTDFLLLQKTKAYKMLNTRTGKSVTWTPSSASSASQTLLGKRSGRANMEEEHRCYLHCLNVKNGTNTAELQHIEPDLVELVHSEPVDAVPLPLHGLKKRLEVQELCGRTRGESVNTRKLNMSITQTSDIYCTNTDSAPRDMSRWHKHIWISLCQRGLFIIRYSDISGGALSSCVTSTSVSITLCVLSALMKSQYW